ncbi:MAG: homocysteine biosynthesis protein, partial [Cyanobacteria bacterium P01_A01_bin.17]
MRTIADINHKIRQGSVKVLTVEALKARVAEVGIPQTAQEVDVVTTGTFEPMESSGAILNLGHTDPPIKIRQCWIDGVLAYSGFGAVDLYLGASQPAETGISDNDGEDARERGGGHVIEDLIAGKALPLRALGQSTDCYPRSTMNTLITRESINQFYLFNP